MVVVVVVIEKRTPTDSSVYDGWRLRM